MTTIQLPNQIIATDLKPKIAIERFKELLYEFVDGCGVDNDIDIDLFVEKITDDTDDESDFRLIDEDSVDVADITINEEDLDLIIEEYLEYGSESEIEIEEDSYADEADDEPEILEEDEE